MPRGVYERKPRYAVPAGIEPGTVTTVVVGGGGSGGGGHGGYVAPQPPMWEAFDRCKGILAPMSGTERRAVIGALTGWFDDGKYE